MQNTIYLTLLVFCIAASGCDTFPVRLTSATSVDNYLAYLDNLNSFDAEDLSEAHNRAATYYVSDPNPGRQLYLALVLAQPGYPENDIRMAQNHLTAVKDDDSLPLAVKRLVRIKLAELEQRLEYQHAIMAQERKVAELRNELRMAETRLRSLNETEQELSRKLDKLHEAESKLRALTKTEQELRRELNEVKIKLRALTDIEQDLSKPDM